MSPFVFGAAATETLTCNTLTIIIHFLNKIKSDVKSKVDLGSRMKSNLQQSSWMDMRYLRFVQQER